MKDYNPTVTELNATQKIKLAELKKSITELRYATFSRWDVMIADNGEVNILESNSCPGAFEDLRQMQYSKNEFPLDKACAQYLSTRGVIGINSMNWNGETVLPLFKKYNIPYVRNSTSHLYLHNDKKQFFFSDKRIGTDRAFIDLLWIRSGIKIGERIRNEVERYESRMGTNPNIPPETFFPALNFLFLSSHKYKTIEAIASNMAQVPPTLYVRNVQQWREQKIILMNMIKETTLSKHPDWKDKFQIVLKPCYGTKGKDINHGTIDEMINLHGDSLKFPLIINPRIYPSPNPVRPESNVDIGIYSVGLNIPTGFVKVAAGSKLESNLCAGGSCLPLCDELKEKLVPHIELAVLSAEKYLVDKSLIEKR